MNVLNYPERGEKMAELKLKKVLADIVGSENVSDADFELVAYSRDMSPYSARRADFIVLPTKTEEVSEILRYANKTNTPVFIRGGGTSTGGIAVARSGGILFDLCKISSVAKKFQPMSSTKM